MGDSRSGSRGDMRSSRGGGESRFRDSRPSSGGGFRRGGPPGGFGGRDSGGYRGGSSLKGKQPGENLRKPVWDMSTLHPFTKDFYQPHPRVQNRYYILILSR